MPPLEVAMRFVALINAHDPERIAALLTRDHKFIDSLGAEYYGRDTLIEAWRQYLGMVPDYQIDITRSFCEGSEVVLLGAARGTYTADGVLDSANAWSTPAAFRAIIRDELVSEWQVYADNEPIRQRMRESSS